MKRDSTSPILPANPLIFIMNQRQKSKWLVLVLLTFSLLTHSYAVGQSPKTTLNSNISNRTEVSNVIGKGVLKTPITPAMAFGKSTVEIQTALEPIALQFQPSVVEFESVRGNRSLGTVVADGLVVGKRSELGESFTCLIDGKKVTSRLVGYQSDHDLALIALNTSEYDRTKLTPITFPAANTTFRVGKLVASMTQTDAARLGMVSVAPQRFDIKQPKIIDGIDLGAVVSPFRVTKAFTQASSELGNLVDTTNQITIQQNEGYAIGLEVSRVYPRTISEQSGLLVGDLIQSVNNVGVSSRSELNSIARNLRVGQQLEIIVIRNGANQRLTTKISDFAPKIMHDRWGGGPFSKKRFGFQQVISHDTVIEPEQCGGPLVDLRGNIVGINIARSMRVATFAIPINAVYDFVTHVQPNAKFKRQK